MKVLLFFCGLFAAITGKPALPEPPTNVRVTEITLTSVRLSWSYNGPKEDLQYYVIQFKPKYDNEENGQPIGEISGIITMFYSVRNLSPYTEYEMYVIAVNNIGKGPPSAPAVVTTRRTDIKLGTAPRNIQARPLSSSIMVIQWDEPENHDRQVTGYKVYYTTNYQVPMAQWDSQVVGNNELTTISELTPHTIYTIRIEAFFLTWTYWIPGPLSLPYHVKLQQGVPSQPSNLRASDIGESSVTFHWSIPTYSGESITAYELYWNDTYAKQKHHRRIPISESYILNGLYPSTLYYVWLAAWSPRGQGAPTTPTPVITKQYVPGEPQDVKGTLINSTTIKVNWKQPHIGDRKGIILGYHVHLQESKEESFPNEPIRLIVIGDKTLELLISVQPNTTYQVQVAALARKGDGRRSAPVFIRTPGGVPDRPALTLKTIERASTFTIELEWSRPILTFGELSGYRVRFGVKNQPLKNLYVNGSTTNYSINDLEQGVEYEFRVAGQNHIGIGQESIKYFHTPEGPPTGPPINITYRFQTPDVVCVTWNPPTREHRNGQILRYEIEFHKKFDNNNVIFRNVTKSKVEFSNLEENTEYVFHVKAHTKQGAGPYSKKQTIQTDKNIERAPINVKAMTTSESSVEVEWEPVASRNEIIGYKIFYTMTAVNDWPIDESQQKSRQKSVGLTYSADLVNLKWNAQYTIAVATRTENGLGKLSNKCTVKVKPEDVAVNLRALEITSRSITLSWSPPIRLNAIKFKISFNALKEFVDSQGITQTQSIPRVDIVVSGDVNSHTINELSPFTTYNINVSAIPSSDSYRPPTKITVTTEMAAPQPIVKPDFYGVDNNEIHVILPQASEEYGPLSHYYLVVVPENESTIQNNTELFLTEDLLNNVRKVVDYPTLPYIAAKFPQRSIPYIYHLGTGEEKEGFTNYKLNQKKRYRIFLRAVVDSRQIHLYTSSPFSEFLSLAPAEQEFISLAPAEEVSLAPAREVVVHPTNNDVKVNPS